MAVIRLLVCLSPPLIVASPLYRICQELRIFAVRNKQLADRDCTCNRNEVRRVYKIGLIGLPNGMPITKEPGERTTIGGQ